MWSIGAALPTVLLLATPEAPDSITTFELIGALFCLLNVVLQGVADQQKAAWHESGGEKLKGEPLLTTGLWGMSR
jgi:steroid 5-alpha reductase family enzyme